MAFRVGQKVECINDKPDRWGRAVLVQKGEVYTVAAVFDWFGLPGLLLEEVKTKEAPGWHALRFRPVVERKTDISIFTAMLTPSKEHVRS